MADSEIQVKISAETSELQAGASQASDAADQISEKLQGIKESAEAGSEGLQAARELPPMNGARADELGNPRRTTN